MAQPTLRLSTRDKNLRKQLTLSEEELARSLEYEQTRMNVNQLVQAIHEEKRPEVRKLLDAEYKRIVANSILEVAEPGIKPQTELPPVSPASLLERLMSIFK